MNSLRKNFNEYIQIMDNHDIVLIASGKGLIEINRNRIFSKEIPQDYIKGTLVNLRLHNNRKIDIYEHMGHVEYVL